ncbi:MAG TPA: hypothetical protein VF856_03820 [Gemmatimonadaceae bacterium]
MTSVSGRVATIHAQKKLCGDIVRPRWLVGRLLAGGEKASRAATREARATMAAIRAAHAAGPNLRPINWNEEVADPL